MVVPGSATVKRQAEDEGLDRVFERAGFEWRNAGCSMCLGMNPDILAPGERCASTSNRNFEGRQGSGGRTHLVSPAMAAAAALAGHFVDVRESVAARMKAFRSSRRGRPSSTGPTSTPTRSSPSSSSSASSEPATASSSSTTGGRIPASSSTVRVRRRQDPAHGPNFGCGSSREHAAWALQDHGFDVVIAPSFGDIFFSNAVQVGLVPVTLPVNEVKALMAAVATAQTSRSIFEARTIVDPAGRSFGFEIDPFVRTCLLEGLDAIGRTLQHESEIAAFESGCRSR